MSFILKAPGAASGKTFSGTLKALTIFSLVCLVLQFIFTLLYVPTL